MIRTYLRSRRTISTVLCLIVFVLGACIEVDNQTIANDVDRAVVNPDPIDRDFETNHYSHKVLLAVIDSGVDYNQPYLINNIHFELDQSGQPIRWGHDFIGDDGWPSPYLARTAAYDSKVSDAWQKNSRLILNLFERFLESIPDGDVLHDYFQSRRHVKYEYMGSAFHGTHVAGLMVYDTTALGLLAYRVLPLNTDYTDDYDGITNVRSARFFDNLERSIDRAVEDGAQIINMSLGDKNIVPDNLKEGSEDKAKFDAKQEYIDRIERTINRHRDVIFVASSGNDKIWFDGDVRVHAPCGLDAPNLICAGALDDHGKPSTFTNLSISGNHQFFVPGVSIASTAPSQMCPSARIRHIDRELVPWKKAPSHRIPLLRIPLPFRNHGKQEKAYAKLAAFARKECRLFTETKLVSLSGTSMSAPLLSRVVGLLWAKYPDSTAEEIIDLLYAQSIPSFIGAYPIYKVPIEPPSWTEPFKARKAVYDEERKREAEEKKKKAEEKEKKKA